MVAMVIMVELDSHSSAATPHSPGSGIRFSSLDIAAGVCEVPEPPVQVEQQGSVRSRTVQVEVCFSLTLPS